MSNQLKQSQKYLDLARGIDNAHRQTQTALDSIGSSLQGSSEITAISPYLMTALDALEQAARLAINWGIEQALDERRVS